jgi:hypothetical protein
MTTTAMWGFATGNCGQIKPLAQTIGQLDALDKFCATQTLGITFVLPTTTHSQEALETIRMLTSGTLMGFA